MLTEKMKAIVREQRLGFVATVCPDGTPNLSPKGTTTVWDEEHLVFAHIHSPGTISNLAGNPSVEVNVVDPIIRNGYRFKGTGQVVEAGELFDRIAALYVRERGLDPGRVCSFVLIKVESAQPLISPVYDLTDSEEEVAATWRRVHCP